MTTMKGIVEMKRSPIVGGGHMRTFVEMRLTVVGGGQMRTIVEMTNLYKMQGLLNWWGMKHLFQGSCNKQKIV